ncbi:hypothetical protein OG417_08430 [Actinoallomurus sp. NBC_01490]|uniref:hypothetical protein n=1 Tax=Actinoallomurus sp. NBC_01490 TaxID=2903557 RepID=UPI002E33195C|nr:hypothetical protein [Actinoallomurus sp. NBC_01490]
MSDQGDAGAWRPATSQNDQNSVPDDTTGPLPKISEEESGGQGFPSVTGQSSVNGPAPSWPADDDAPTGGFPAVSPSEEQPAPASPSSRSPFEPADRTESPREPADEVEDPGPNGATPKFGTEVQNPRPAEQSFGSFDDSSFSDTSFGDSSFRNTSFGDASFGDASFGDASSGSGSFGTSSFGDSSSEPAEPETPGSFGSGSFGSTGFDDKPFGSNGFDDKPAGVPRSSYGRETFSAESSYGRETFSAESAPESSYGRETFSAESGAAVSSGTGAPPEGVSSTTGAFSLPQAEKRPTAEDEAAENDFFAPDDHPPMWDKVVAPSGPPPKPGKPSSGNLRLPEWMREEGAAGGGGEAGGAIASYDDEEGGSRRPLFIGVGILVVGLVAVAGVYFLKNNGDSKAAPAAAPTTANSPSRSPSQPAQEKEPARKALPRFKGVHTKALGRLADRRSGLSYARFAKPWAAAAKNSPMNELGFSTSQFAVTEKAGGQPKHWARLMSAELSGAAKDAYTGPGTERAAAAEAARVYEARMFGFQHKKRVLANEPLTIGGHKGWLVSDYLTYRRPGVKATGDIVAVALVDTGKKTPGIVFMTVPNTNKKLWPDINFVVRSLRVLST